MRFCFLMVLSTVLVVQGAFAQFKRVEPTQASNTTSLRSIPATKNPSEAEIQQIIQKFAAKETEFARARDFYTYRQSNKIQEFDESGNPAGKYEMVSDVTFNNAGKRQERVVRAPVTTLQRILMTPEDEQDLRSVMPFVLTTQDLNEYYVRYLGKQRVDEIDCYVFAVKPKELDKSGKRYFSGEVWVDDRDLQIVKTYGRSTGYLKKKGQQFPKFETYREQIDGKYWFPTYTYADDVLNFETGPQRIRVVVKYEDYKQFKSDTVITFDDVEAPSSQPQNGQPAPSQPPAAPSKP